jgi:hypothetical protein
MNCGRHERVDFCCCRATWVPLRASRMLEGGNWAAVRAVVCHRKSCTQKMAVNPMMKGVMSTGVNGLNSALNRMNKAAQDVAELNVALDSASVIGFLLDIHT